MKFDTFKNILNSDLMRRDLPDLGMTFCTLLENHGEVQVDMASGKKYSLHLGDLGCIDSNCITVKLFDGRIVVLNWSQIENCWIHLANDEG